MSPTTSCDSRFCRIKLRAAQNAARQIAIDAALAAAAFCLFDGTHAVGDDRFDLANADANFFGDRFDAPILLAKSKIDYALSCLDRYVVVKIWN